MKKNLKYFLMGAGTVVAGFFAYALFKDQPKDDIAAEPATNTTPSGSSAAHRPSQEYVDHRREAFRARAAQRTASPVISEDAPAENAEEQEGPVQSSEDGTAPAPKDNAPADSPETEACTPVEASGEDVISNRADLCEGTDEGTEESENQEESEEDRKE